MEEPSSDCEVCFICLKSDEPIMPFKEATLEKCRYSLAVRVTNNLKDKEKTLPSQITGDSIGYHCTCYRIFNAIGKKYRDFHEKGQASEKDEEALENIRGPDARVSISKEQSLGCSSERVSSPAVSYNEAVGEDDNDTVEAESAEAPESCIFCGKQFKTHKRNKMSVRVTENYESMNAHKEYATKTNDTRLLSRLHDHKGNCQPIPYHPVCKTSYRNHAVKLLNKKNTEWHKNRKVHATAFRKLCDFIHNNVVKGKKCYSVTFLRQHFRDLLIEEYKGSGVDHSDTFFTRHIPKKILAQKMFKSKVRSIKCNNKLIVAPRNVTVIDSFDEL